jgi:hypothetical protein
MEYASRRPIKAGLYTNCYSGKAYFVSKPVGSPAGYLEDHWLVIDPTPDETGKSMLWVFSPDEEDLLENTLIKLLNSP